MLEYEREGNIKVLENKLLKTRQTFVRLGIEEKDEYQQFLNQGHKYVIFIDQANVRDMDAVPVTQTIFQVQGSKIAHSD
eukprot:2088780-Ditylum_brightwellii.AAC.1